MQIAFDFGAVDDLTWARDRLRAWHGRPGPVSLRTPVGQLVKSSISGRTRDEVSRAAYQRLVQTCPQWSGLAEASVEEIQAAIGDVTFPDAKARHLREALRIIAASRPDFDLSFLGGLSVANALAWLERLPGVGRKVAACTLNFSTLNMPALVVDAHILRILIRCGFVSGKADARTACDAVVEAAHAWSAADLRELHIVMKRLGQTICRANQADCPDCPLRQRCRAAAFSRRRSSDRSLRRPMAAA